MRRTVNRPANAAAICPYFSNVTHNGRAIICTGCQESFLHLRVQFRDTVQRIGWSEDYCEGYLYYNCPFYQGLKEEQEMNDAIQ